MQTYTLSVVSGDRRTGAISPITDLSTGADSFRKPFDYSGTKTFGGAGNYDAYADGFIYDVDIPACSGGRVFVGQRYEAFKLALGEVFDLVNFVPIQGDSNPGALDEFVESE